MKKSGKRDKQETLKEIVALAGRLVDDAEKQTGDPFIFTVALDLALRVMLHRAADLPGFREQYDDACAMLREQAIIVPINEEGEN